VGEPPTPHSRRVIGAMITAAVGGLLAIGRVFVAL
jgi:hypothetical protein